ncbi:unnamed protein product, partial [Discosporangium mesarthrocarpum]
VTYSEDRLEEARVLRGRMQRCLALAASASRERERLQKGSPPAGTVATADLPPPPRRWGNKERALMAALSQCKREVHQALCHDFDTPRVMSSLSVLCGLTVGHLEADVVGEGGGEGAGGGGGKVLEPALSAAAYLASTLTMLGVEGPEGMGVGAAAGSGEDQDAIAMVIQAMADFRGSVRALALASGEGEPSEKIGVAGNAGATAAAAAVPAVAYSDMKRELLALCDEARDGVLGRLGVNLVDKSDGTHRWMRAPPSTQGNPLAPGRGQGPGKRGEGAGIAGASPSSSSEGLCSWQNSEERRRARLQVPPEELFRVGEFKGMFSAFDTDHVPTHHAEEQGGKQLSKSARKRLAKVMAKH